MERITTTDIIVDAAAAASYFSSDLNPSMVSPSGPGESSRPSSHSSRPRTKRRTKCARYATDATANSTPPAPSPNKTTQKPDPAAPKITRPCTECGRRFWSWKALFGHMRCHPERGWRGIDPPPGFRRPEHGGASGGDSFSVSEEEREVAACLLLLSGGLPPALNNTPSASCASDQLMPAPEYSEDLDVSAVVWGRFECSSCKKVFGSHQALGGHRASHKSVKGCYAITKSSSIHGQELEGCCSGDNQIVSSMDSDTNTYNDIDDDGDDGHTCNICFRVFTSGQALGGHMRCHWEKVGEPISRVFGFDLNSAAPIQEDYGVEDDNDVACSSGITLDLRLGL